MNNELKDLLSQKEMTGRHHSQLFVFEELYKRFSFEPINIVETGCIRNPTPMYKMGDGWGTLSWMLWANKTRSSIRSIDINPVHIEIARQVTGNSPWVTLICSDSIKYLKELNESFKIDFLFLDSYDYGPTEEEKKASAEHQLKEIQACEKNLEENSLILLDDILDVKSFAGKGALSIPYLLKTGYQILNYQDTQVLLSK